MTEIPTLTPRHADSHKGDFGRALLIGGSRGMSGAIVLAGKACLRSGAGLVTLAAPESCLDVVAGFDPCFMTVPLEEDPNHPGQLAAVAGRAIGPLVEKATCVAFGPGLGRSSELNQLAAWLYKTADKPLVVDADGLNALAAQPDILAEHTGPRVLTPHPGEFARLIGESDLSRDQQEQRAHELAAANNLVVVLKGHRTFITDGSQSAHNETGNPGMATGGSGDVLTGIITALICQGMSPFDAASRGAFSHGRAGDLAEVQVGQVSLVASDIVQHLPSAFRGDWLRRISFPYLPSGQPLPIAYRWLRAQGLDSLEPWKFIDDELVRDRARNYYREKADSSDAWPFAEHLGRSEIAAFELVDGSTTGKVIEFGLGGECYGPSDGILRPLQIFDDFWSWFTNSPIYETGQIIGEITEADVADLLD